MGRRLSEAIARNERMRDELERLLAALKAAAGAREPARHA